MGRTYRLAMVSMAVYPVSSPVGIRAGNRGKAADHGRCVADEYGSQWVDPLAAYLAIGDEIVDADFYRILVSGRLQARNRSHKN